MLIFICLKLITDRVCFDYVLQRLTITHLSLRRDTSGSARSFKCYKVASLLTQVHHNENECLKPELPGARFESFVPYFSPFKKNYI